MAGTDDEDEAYALRRAADEAAKHGEFETGQLNELFLGDIRINVKRFAAQIHALNEAALECPVVQYGNGACAPLDILNSANPTGATSQILNSFEKGKVRLASDDAYENARGAGFLTKKVSSNEARDHFAHRLYEFVSRRYESARGLFGAGEARAGTNLTPGLEITVTTRSFGYRVLATPHYFPALGGVFGNNLSTPVYGVLPPGEYVFGAEHPGGMPEFETTPHRIPPITVVNMVIV